MRPNPIAPRQPSIRPKAPRTARGPLTEWARTLSRDARTRLFDQLVRSDVALASTIAHWRDSSRVSRVCLLLMNECAASRGLSLGELAMLSPAIERESIEVMHWLRPASAPDHRQRR